MASERELQKYKRLCGMLSDALSEYADPEFYHAIGFAFDRPTGGFGSDFDRRHENAFYNRPMPGKLARSTLRKAVKKYGDLRIYTKS